MNNPGKYDVIVVGDSIGGLVSAALLAKRGVRCLLVGGRHFSSSYMSDGYSFNIGPLRYRGFERGGLFDMVLSELGLGLPLLKNEDSLFHSPSPFMQVAMPGNRININENPDEIVSELKREFSGQEEKLDKFFALVEKVRQSMLPVLEKNKTRKVSFSDKLSYAEQYFAYLRCNVNYGRQKAIDFLEASSFKKDLIRLFDLLLRFYYNKGASQVNSLELFALIWMLDKKLIGFCKGGHTVLSSVLKKSFVKSGGTFIEGSEMADIVCNGRKVAGIKTIDDDLIESSCVIINVAKASKDESELKSLYLFFGVLNKSVPCAMHENVVITEILDANNARMDENVWVSLNYEECGHTPDGMRAVRVCVLIDEKSLVDDGIEKLKKRAIESLLNLMPFAREGLKYLGYYLVDYNDSAGSNCGDTYKAIYNNIKVANSLQGCKMSSSYSNLKLIPELFEPCVSSGLEAQNALDIANEIKSPRFSFVRSS